MKNLSPRTQGLVAINVAAVIFGSAALFGKLEVSPFWIVAMRAGFAALALFIFGVMKKDIGLPPGNLWRSVLTTGVILAVHWLTFFASVQMVGVAIATLTFSVFPLFTILIETSYQKRRPRLTEVAAATAIIFAVGLLIKPQDTQNNMLGIAAGLASALTFAWFGHASKQLGKVLSPLRISFVQNAVVGVVLAPFLLFVSPAPHQPMDWVWLALLGIVTTAIMHQLYFYALRRLSASTCSGFVALEPVYAIFFAVLFFHEPMTTWVVVSGGLIMGASYALLRQEAQH